MKLIDIMIHQVYVYKLINKITGDNNIKTIKIIAVLDLYTFNILKKVIKLFIYLLFSIFFIITLYRSKIWCEHE